MTAPVVGDVDGDGNAEMVLTSSDDYVYGAGCDEAWKDAGLSIDNLCEITDCITGPPCTGGIGGTCSDSGDWCDASGTCRRPGGTPGVRVYGDANDRWVRTRPVWNQFSNHVTNFTLQNGWRCRSSTGDIETRERRRKRRWRGWGSPTGPFTNRQSFLGVSGSAWPSPELW
jgi:hypothetical protein